MKLDAVLSWYQKKIGTYDKQQWEKTVEQKILSGLTSITLKNAKLKTELIDVDLVRGSTFPKAKPKQSLLTVIKFAILRYFFLPLYAKWWVSQTSAKTFVILLCLYISQLFNWAAYSYHIQKVVFQKEYILPLLELVLPIALSLILSFIHSQIVATSGVSNATTKHKRVLTTSGKSREPVRRRKKLVKMRSTESDNGFFTKTRSRSSNGIFQNQNYNATSKNSNCIGDISTETLIIIANKGKGQSIIESKVKIDQTDSKNELEAQFEDSLSSRKRNVNWDSPIHNFANDSNVDAKLNGKASLENNGIIVRNSPKTKTVRIDDCIQEFYEDLIQYADDYIVREHIEPNNNPNFAEQTVEDDGFESLNGKSSSGEETPIREGSNADQSNSCLEQLPVNDPVLLQIPNQVQRQLAASNLSVTFKTAASDDERLFKAKKSDLNTVGGKKMFNVCLPGFRERFPLSSESDADRNKKIYQKSLSQAEVLHKKYIPCRSKESSDTDEEGDDGEVISSPVSIGNPNYTECTTSATEWLGITTNSEECSYSSEFENSDFQPNHSDDGIDHDFAPTVILNPSCGSNDRISCTIWEHRDVKKAELSVLDISSCIIERVEDMPETCDYLYIGVAFSVILSLVPIIYRLCEATELDSFTEINYLDIPLLLWEKASFSSMTLFRFALGETKWEIMVVIIAFLQRLSLTFTLFFLFAVAERTFKQRFLYAKLFSHLTSSRRAQKSNLPHFRLNKVRNIKTWLSVRSYLKRRGPQRSVEVIVSSAFIITLLLLAFLSVEWMKDSVQVHTQLNLEALLWSSALGIFLLRFMTLGNKINRKYRCISVLITEQINLYLQIEQKPKKKEELMVSNSVLKLAADLLKELESPFKISGLSANPYLYTIIKVVMLSALSGVLSEMLGFKLKLHKIKIK